ncbi:hypothetical protein TDB9533_03197 [Thalassocella blandensis]|nr:hypothetical protein TDB9533_03197 [Thalassocella blandensis]
MAAYYTSCHPLLRRANMKRLLFRIGIAYLLLNVVLAVIFVSVGGFQMLHKATLPVENSSPSIRSDVNYLRDVVLANEKDISDAQAAEFLHVIDSAPLVQNEDELSLLAMRALAVFDNAHTTVLKSQMYHLPLRFHWTADGLIIVKAQAHLQQLLGRKVVSLGGISPEALLSKTEDLIGGGTASWRRYRSQFLYTSPSVLAFMGAQVNERTVELGLRDYDGLETLVEVTAEDELKSGDPFWDFRHAFPDNTSFDTEGWVSLLNKNQQLPLYLQNSDKLHLLRALPEHSLVYLRMNASFADKGETFEQLQQRLQNLAAEHQTKHFIVDFRFNRGGDYTKVLPIVRATADAVASDGTLYLIVGRNTFSAGIIAASQFKRYLPKQLKVVGSEMGDKLRFRAEGFYPTLPASGIQLYLTKGWTDLKDGCSWLDDCWPPNKFLLREVGSLPIDIPIENTWESYRTGEDLILKTILSQISVGHDK